MPTVMLVDDSATARLALRRALASDPSIDVIAEVSNGRAALAQLAMRRVDLIIMDVFLDGEDGLELATRIMRRHPTPILIVTGADASDTDLLLRVVETGALELLAKPPSAGAPGHERACRRLCRLVKTLAGVPVVTHKRGPALARDQPLPLSASTSLCLDRAVVLIGASTGGPPILRAVLAAIPCPFPLPIVLVQHIAQGFCVGMAEWLQASTKHVVSVCEHSRRLGTGEVIIAPDDRHLRVLPGWRVGPFVGPPREFQRPSVNELFETGAAVFGPAAVGILLTGMGRDGVVGLGALRKAGALTIAQRPDTCAAEGMPKLAIERGFATHTLSPTEIASALSELARAGAQPRSLPLNRRAVLGTSKEQHV